MARAMPVLEGLLTLLPVTASTLTIALVLLVLLGDGGARAAWALVGGWFVGAWLVLWLSMAGLALSVDPQGRGLPPGVQVGLGLASMALGVAVLVRRYRRRRGGGAAELARLARLADGITPVRAAALGLALMAASPRQWLFLVPAAEWFLAASVAAGRLWLPLLGAAVASLGVLLPVLVALVADRSSPQLLPALRGWWDREGDTVGGAVAVIVGSLLLASGLARL
jgi:hypothetical protein